MLRNAPLLLVFVLITGCSDVETVPRLQKFEYSRDSLGNGKQFIYRKITRDASPLDSILVMTRKVVTEDDDTYFVLETGDGNTVRTIDRYKILADGYQYSDAIFFFTDSASGNVESIHNKILEYRQLPGEYRGVTTAMKVNANGYIMETKAIETFQREDSVMVMGKKLNALTFSLRTTLKGRHRFAFFVSSENTYNGEFTIAEGMDLVRYSSDFSGTMETWELVDIRNVK